MVIAASKSFIKGSVFGLSLYVTNSYSQTFVWASLTGSKNCMLFKQLSPTSDYGNRWNVIYVNKDSLLFRHPHVYQDSLKLRNDILVGNGKIMWMDSATGHMNASRLDSIHVNWNHINFRPINLSEFTNGPGYLTGADTVGKWMPQGATYDRSNTNEIQTLTYTNSILSISGGNTVGISIPETQTLVPGSGIDISGTNPYTITATQTLTSITSSTGISISSGSVITNTLPDQTVTIASAGIATVSGAYPNFTCGVTVPPSTLSVNGGSLSISNGNTVTLPGQISYYNASGTITAVTKVFNAVITPTSSNGYTINISSAGFSSITGPPQITAAKNASVATSCPNVSVKSYNNTQIVVNIIEGNPATVNILGSLVLLGEANVFADVTGLTLHVRVEGN